jgi:hypothetical protein
MIRDPADIRKLCNRISMSVLGRDFGLRIERDIKDPVAGRIFLQIEYESPCIKTKELVRWRGRKWYLSDHMTDDEIIKTAFSALEAAVNHEVLEGFKVDGITMVNPHVHFESLLRVSHLEVKRAPAQSPDPTSDGKLN